MYDSNGCYRYLLSGKRRLPELQHLTSVCIAKESCFHQGPDSGKTVVAKALATACSRNNLMPVTQYAWWQHKNSS